MRLNSVKVHLAPYSILAKRRTTISHAFASALAPVDVFDSKRFSEALPHLGLDASGDLMCAYCDRPAETWDHVVGLVKNSELFGYGHQIGNLVPCCRNCNSKKGNKEWKTFIFEERGDTDEARRRIGGFERYLNEYATEVDRSALQDSDPDVARYNDIRSEIFRLMQEADRIAGRLRERIRRVTE